MPPSKNHLAIERYFLLSLIVFACTYRLSGQDPEFVWAKNIGGSSGERGRAVVSDASGNTYSTGIYFGTVDFDPGPGVYNLVSGISANGYILKLNIDGEFVWAKRIGGTNRCDGWDVDVDADGNVIATGVFQGTVDFDPGPGTYNLSSSSLYDVFVLKLSAEGNFLWARNLGTTASHQIFRFSVRTDYEGSVYASGHYSGTGDFDPGPGVFTMSSVSNSDDVFVVKLNNLGEFVWAKSVGGAGSDWNYSMDVDNDRNVVITGKFAGTADFDPDTSTYNLTSHGGDDIFVLKLDSLGALVWVNHFGAANADIGTAIITDVAGNIFTTGLFRGTVDFDPGPGVFNISSTGGSLADCFVLKLNGEGELVWARHMGGTGTDFGFSISLNPDGQVFTTGSFSNTADFDPGSEVHNLVASTTSNIFISILGSTGDFNWVGQLGGNPSLSEEGTIHISGNGDIIATSHFTASGDFDPGAGTYDLFSNGSQDIFLVKLSQETCNEVSIISQPVSRLSNTCDSVSFSVLVSGDGPFDFEWYRDEFLIAGATTSSYTTPLLTLADNGSEYYCIVSNCDSMESDTSEVAVLTVVQCVSSTPAITLNHSVCEPGETLVISGERFTIGGPVAVTVRDQWNQNLAEGIPVTYTGPGRFELSLPITAGFFPDLYTVVALDLVTGITAPYKSFLVDNQVFDEIEIIDPTPESMVYRGKSFTIVWRDYIDNFNSFVLHGFAVKTYRVEISVDFGSSWTLLKDVTARAYAHQLNTFSTQYTVSDAQSIMLRVTDQDQPTNTDDTLPILVAECDDAGFSQTLEWDPTVSGVFRRPVGLAADGAARVLIRLSKDPSNTKSVNTIQAALSSVANGYTSPALLGKIMYAENYSTYSEDANEAHATSVLYPALANNNQNASAYWFWLVAPDDFTTNLEEMSAERQISATFTITYTDNSVDVITSCPPIAIFRPGLVFVHGMASNPDSWKSTAYVTEQEETIEFLNSKEWKVIQRINLYERDFFEVNANLILEKAVDENYGIENSIKYALYKMHSLGIANKRVDYVCHSMGGSVGRTAMNEGGEWYSPGVGRFKNYQKGYINKFITICTPHNGSYLADFMIDAALAAGDALGKAIFFKMPGLRFIWNIVGEDLIYLALPGAGRDLQTFSGGKVLGQTNITNHLIAADMDQANNQEESIILNNAYNGGNEFPGLSVLRFFNRHNLLNTSFNELYGTMEFFSETDGVVQLSSQFAGKGLSGAVNITTNPTGIGNTSIIYGLDKGHMGIQGDRVVGTRVKRLLNAEMNSGFFDTTILANTLPQHVQGIQMQVSRQSVPTDTIFNRIDTQYIKIISPLPYDTSSVDSTLAIVVHVKDTIGLQQVRILWQSRVYLSDSANTFQAFQTYVQPDHIGRNLIVALAEYDSLGFTVHHIDTLPIVIGSLDTLADFYVTPNSIALNPGQYFEPEFHAVHPTFLGLIDPLIPGLEYFISDTNVVVYDTSLLHFVAKDTGSTNIVFMFNGLADTVAVYLNSPFLQNALLRCPLDTISLYAGSSDPDKMYQWQIDSSGTFIDASDNLILSGTGDSMLVMSGIPSAWYNYKFKCLISDAIGFSESEVYILQYASTWTGTVSTAWENPENWSCGVIPDEYTDVHINDSAPNPPEVNSVAVCRKLTLGRNAMITIKPGFELQVSGND